MPLFTPLPKHLVEEYSPNNVKDVSKVSAGSGSDVLWVCDLGHEYNARPNDRKSHGTGCPYCSSRRILVGFNDISTTAPEVAAEFDFNKNDFPVESIMRRSRKDTWWL